MSIIFAAALIAGSTFYEDEAWIVSVAENSCSLGTMYEGGKALILYRDDAYNNADLFLVDPSFRKETAGKEYNLDLVFTDKSGLDDGWGKVEATGVDLKDQYGLRITLNSKDLLQDMAESTALALVNGEVIITAFSLKGSAIAVQKLEQCAAEVRDVRPSDPLAGLGKK